MATQADRTATTRAALVAAGRQLFAERGFAATSTEELLAAASVSRGAMYHHFSGKEGLFEAVHEAVESDLTRRVVTASLNAESPLAQLKLGIASFLDQCRDPEVQRIALLDGPTVLGWAKWHEIEERFALGLIKAAVASAIASGELAEQPVDPVAHAILGAMIQAGSVVALAPNPAKAKRELTTMFNRLLDGLSI